MATRKSISFCFYGNSKVFHDTPLNIISAKMIIKQRGAIYELFSFIEMSRSVLGSHQILFFESLLQLQMLSRRNEH